MTAQQAITSPVTVKLTVPGFLLLRRSGAFDDYWKAELLDGELWGVPAAEDGQEPESDATSPIKVTVEQYELLDRAGVFVGCGKTELVDGKVYAMSPQYRPHGFVKDELAYRLRRSLEAIGSSLHVATEQSVAITPFSEPQPDIALTCEPIGRGAIPLVSVALIVEISDATGAFDRRQKAAVYAAADIPEYWIADVNRRSIRKLWAPVRGKYTEQSDIPFDENVTSLSVPGLTIETRDLSPASLSSSS